ncbi:hypothetical protein [Halobacillus sp. BBL2006]|uniref:hypothetical protein n=1 Tax=Halobacillus sp. BBL2006 TaxID=1543706 RepID=UPI001E2E4BF5|nr:hypothetical protein [Halobacillus sp. BBL2006]
MAGPRVIAITSVSGGGKTTITEELKHSFLDSRALHFDDYDYEQSPKDLIEWVEAGADYDQWKLTPLIADMKQVLNDEKTSYLWLDYPFAYQNKEMANFLDLVIYIDTPLDIAMARRVIRDYADHSLSDVFTDLTFYIERGRIGYLEMEKTIKTDSDVVINGTYSPAVIAEEIKRYIRRGKGR